ncbi:MAG: helix-turn-helix domain-containing protein [Bacilli bacterium]|nr:helix-turn-helix domain-containing protein [Bacilli bacterium]
MMFGKNLQYLRKINNLTQEQLADKLEVSRQTVSKWELDVNLPETETIVLICEMFNCKMDELMRGNVRAIDMETTITFNKVTNKFIALNLISIGLIFLGVVLMLFLLSRNGNSVALPIIVLLVCVTFGVVIIIPNGLIYDKHKKKHENFLPTFSEKQLEKFEKLYNVFITVSIGIIMLATVFLVAYILVDLRVEKNIILVVALYMIFISMASLILIWLGMLKEKYNFNEHLNNQPDKLD